MVESGGSSGSVIAAERAEPLVPGLQATWSLMRTQTSGLEDPIGPLLQPPTALPWTRSFQTDKAISHIRRIS
jgi:hypothetical protein